MKEIFIWYIYDSFIEKFDKFEDNEKENIRLLEKFMLFLGSFDFEKIKEEDILMWKYSLKDMTYKEKLDFVNKLNIENKSKKLSFKEENTIEINSFGQHEITNINDYIFVVLCKKIYVNSVFKENELINYVKITKLDNHLYIRRIWDFWKQFNISLFSSKTIQSLYLTLFISQKKFIVDQEELSIVFDNIDFFIYPTEFLTKTVRTNLKIFEDANMLNIKNEDLAKVILLAKLLISNEHEILGHFNIGYQNYYNKNEFYYSPIIDKNLRSNYADKRKGRESGENIEIKLYGKFINSLTLKEAIFILDNKNYFGDFNEFREKFQNCNKKNLIIDQTLKINLEKLFQINVNKLPQNDNNSYSFSCDIKKNNDNENIYFMKPRHSNHFDMDGSEIEFDFEGFRNFRKMLELTYE